jgi:ElaB/YqjD/DUF883 family membrane-anchored ribosome-binding protein
MADQVRRVSTMPRDPAVVRAELARTRARMSATIGEIEDVLVQKKDVIVSTAKGIRDRLDPFYKARQHPMAAIGIVFGAGLVVGVLTGGKKPIPPQPSAAPPSDLWQRRARRLLRIAREQQEEIAELQEQTSGWEEVDEADADEDDYYYDSPDDELDED